MKSAKIRNDEEHNRSNELDLPTTIRLDKQAKLGAIKEGSRNALNLKNGGCREGGLRRGFMHVKGIRLNWCCNPSTCISASKTKVINSLKNYDGVAFAASAHEKDLVCDTRKVLCDWRR